MEALGLSAYSGSMNESKRQDHAALVALLRAPRHGKSWAELTAVVLEAGSAFEVWQALEPAALLPHPAEPDPLESAFRDVDLWEQQGRMLITILDPEYPERLRGIHQAPPFLFASGALLPQDTAVSVVGSRAASARGLSVAATVARELASRNVTVVAGLALGIDTAAHRAALDAGGRTVAVIGTGINKSYPAANRELQQEIMQEGLVLSQFWPDAPPQKHTFLMRNATMSGYGMATIVVEAGETSGARAQARMAVEHGRPVILTDMVVERNEWAKGLVGRPGVHVASDLRSLVALAEKLIAKSADVDAELRRMVSA
jgi:DNA processing protein